MKEIKTKTVKMFPKKEPLQGLVVGADWKNKNFNTAFVVPYSIYKRVKNGEVEGWGIYEE